MVVPPNPQPEQTQRFRRKRLVPVVCLRRMSCPFCGRWKIRGLHRAYVLPGALSLRSSEGTKRKEERREEQLQRPSLGFVVRKRKRMERGPEALYCESFRMHSRSQMKVQIPDGGVAVAVVPRPRFPPLPLLPFPPPPNSSCFISLVRACRGMQPVHSSRPDSVINTTQAGADTEEESRCGLHFERLSREQGQVEEGVSQGLEGAVALVIVVVAVVVMRLRPVQCGCQMQYLMLKAV